MKLGFLAAAAIAPLTFFASERVAAAEEPRPIKIEYFAPPPPECASVEAFRERVSAEVAREPRARTDWQFTARISRVGGGYRGYRGTLATASAARDVAAPTCDETAAALARLIAADEPDAAPATLTEATTADETAPSPKRGPHTELRIGARAQAWTHGTPGFAGGAPMSYGGAAVVSGELPRGIFHKTLLEGAGGVMVSTAPGQHLTYFVVDLQVCPIDVSFGESGVSLLGCNRLAGAWFQSMSNLYGYEPGGALWFGTGARLRWQSGSPLFVELHANFVYGTVSGPEVPDPAWFDSGAMVGARL
jgi:hypothetical protein